MVGWWCFDGKKEKDEKCCTNMDGIQDIYLRSWVHVRCCDDRSDVNVAVGVSRAVPTREAVLMRRQLWGAFVRRRSPG